MKAEFKTVQHVLENYKSSAVEKDVEKFLSAYADDIHLYDCWDNWECRGISKWRESVTEWFSGLAKEGATLDVDFDDVVIQENSRIAFIHCTVTYTGSNKSGEKLHEMTNRFTFGLRCDDGSWKICHEHSSLPIRMETGKGIFDARR